VIRIVPPRLERYHRAIRRANAVRLNGRLTRVVGVLVESAGPAARIGEICEIHYSRNDPPMLAEVVGFREDRVLLMPYGEIARLARHAEVVATGRSLYVPGSEALLGRVLDGLGRPLDGRPPVEADELLPS